MDEFISIFAIVAGFGAAMLVTATARQTRLVVDTLTHRTPKHTLNMIVDGERISIDLRNPEREENEKIDHAISILRRHKNEPHLV